MAIYAMPLGSAIKLQVRAAKKQPGLPETFYADTAVNVRPALVSYTDGATTLKLLGRESVQACVVTHSTFRRHHISHTCTERKPTVSNLSRALVRATALAGIGALVAALLSSCGAGQVTQTSRMQPPIGGINLDLGDIAIRNAYVVAPSKTLWQPNTEVPLSIYLANIGTQEDRILAISSPDAKSVQLVLPGTQLPTPPSSHAEPAASIVRGAAAGQPTANVAANNAWKPLTVGPHTIVILRQTGTSVSTEQQPAFDKATDAVLRPGYLVLAGLHHELRSGDTVTVQLRFERAGTVTLRLPVAVPETSRPHETSVAGSPQHE